MVIYGGRVDAGGGSVEAVVPTCLGKAEAVSAGIDGRSVGYDVTIVVESDSLVAVEGWT
jgi:hypothetical protein